MTEESDVRELALALPETTEKPSYGTPGFRVRDRLFARMREQRDVLVVWVANLDEKEFLIGAEPAKFFTTPHYDGYPMVLVRLPAVDRDELAELLTESWRLRAPKRVLERFDAAG
ncbi:MAG: MmcQ/YjbR family DNA-binding protein [Solirubrobacteraceae bacterium]